MFALLFGDENGVPISTTARPVLHEHPQINNSFPQNTTLIKPEKGFFELLRDGWALLEEGDEEIGDNTTEKITGKTSESYEASTIIMTTSSDFLDSKIETTMTSMVEKTTILNEIETSTVTLLEQKLTKNDTTTVKQEISTTTQSVDISSTTPTPTTTTTTTYKPEQTRTTEKVTEQPSIATEIIATEIQVDSIPITTTTTMLPFKPLTYNTSSSLLSVLFNMFDISKTTTPKSLPLLNKEPVTPQTTTNIKINPLIVEPHYNFDYDEPTLPPSLPNLRIIQFVPDDAVELRTEDLEKYPSITEQSLIDRYDDLNKFSYNNKNNFDYEHVGEIAVGAGWGDYYLGYQNYNKDTDNNKNVVDRFSPPAKTEGVYKFNQVISYFISNPLINGTSMRHLCG